MTTVIPPAPYVGRFAPSPTGPLHFGSLVAALASCLDARTHGGQWRLRLEDVDRPRCTAKAADQILRTLEAYGFGWDGPVSNQSSREQRYQMLLDRLIAEHRAYPCACSRRELADSAIGDDGAPIYPGTCRAGLPPGKQGRTWRLRVESATIAIDDALQGPLRQNLAQDVGDFILRRADGMFAYQLAVVADDADQGITHVIRGADLLGSTPRQHYLQICLGLPTPRYAHLPVAVNHLGEKLSKQTRAPALDSAQAGPTLIAALEFLGQQPPTGLERASVNEIWRWASAAWSLARVPKTLAVSVQNR